MIIDIPRGIFGNTTETVATAPPISPAAEGMRHHRKRRAEGLRCVAILIRATDVDVLVGRGWLKPEMRNSRNAISNAVHESLDEIVSVVP